MKRRIRTGAAWRWELAWRNAEDSRKLNTPYVERLNLTIRQGSAYLFRRTICQARRKQRLDDHLELLRCQYNFLMPHRALKFGRQVRTPAMQAGLTRRRMTFRDIFSSISFVWLFRKIQFVFAYRASSVPNDDLRLSGAALQHSIAEAPKWVYILSRRTAKKLIPAKMQVPVSTEGGFS